MLEKTDRKAGARSNGKPGAKGNGEAPSLREVKLTDNARVVLEKRYLRRGPDGKPVEGIPQMFWRVAHHVALAEREWGGAETDVEEEFYDLLTSLRFFPNSPTFTGAGTPLGQLAACFVLKIEDDMGRSSAGIFQTLRDAALIQQTGGGNGFAFSRLRPKKALVKSSAGEATGPVGFLRVYDEAFGEIAQGGCLLPETLVFTDRGLLRLDEIVNPQTPGWQPHTLQVATDEGWRTSPRAYNNGIAPVRRVHTREGLSLAGTPEHRVKVMTDNGPEWRALDEMRPGDWLLVRLGQHRGRLQALRHPRPTHGNQTWPKLPSVLDEELAFFLGYLTGDGFVASQADDHRVGVTVAHTSYLMVEMPALMARVFGVKAHAQQKPNDRSVTLVLHNRAVKELLQLNGFDKGRSREARVPRLIRQSPPEVVGAYLRGLLEADGSLSHGYPNLTTTSARLAEEVATLLIGLGCPVRTRSVAPGITHYGNAQVYHVRIESTVGLQAWRERIGCDPRSRFVVAQAWESDERRESAFVLPAPRYWLQPVLEAITLEQVDARGRGLGRKFRSPTPRLRRALLRYLRDERQFTRSAYDALGRAYPEFASHARSLEGLWFVQVNGVEAMGEALTLDLEVDENHTYLAHGLVTHNTRRGANMAVLRVDHPDIEEFITCKTDENAITNFNISVGVTDAFMRAVKDDAMWELRFPDVYAPEYHGFQGTLEQAEKAGVPMRVYKQMRARELFAKIVRYAHHNGEPGVLFLDAANRENPVPHLYELEATNPCITGETLIYTDSGLRRADALAASGQPVRVATDGRFGTATLLPASPVFSTGVKDVYRLITREGYELRLTDDHRVMTPKGWRAANELRPGDKVHVFNRKGGFGASGSLETGQVLGWLVGDGTINAIRAVLSFFGDEKRELAPLFAQAVTSIVEHPQQRRAYPLGVTHILERDEARVSSERLRAWAAEHGLAEDKFIVPEAVLTGNEAMQRGFLQALFTADGQVNGGGEKGCSVRLSSSHLPLLKDVQRLLLNFGIASHIDEQRRAGGYRLMPNGRGGTKEYFYRPQHDLAISKTNLIHFADEIGFLTEAKQGKLADYLSRMTRGPYQETFLATVAAVEPDGREAVYDLQQPDTRSFVANGLVVHNCGEQFLGPFENCCLGSINLAQHFGPEGAVDWEKLRQSTVLSTRFLDDVVSANAYVPAVPQLREAAYKARRIGLGIMGLGDLMYHAGVRYGSDEAQEFAAQVMEFVRYHCLKTSVEMAEERGPFLAIEGSLYDPKNLTWSPPKPLTPYTRDYGRPAVNWDEIVEGIQQHGLRNACQTTVAPTGTIATVAGCESYGCEPVFALAYIRHVNDRGRDLALTYTSPMFETALIKAGVDEAARARIVEQVLALGSCQGIAEVPEPVRHTFVVSQDITAEEHVRMQAAIQAFVDNSISKCVTGDTLVLTAQGLTAMADLAEMRLPDQFEPMELEVITPSGRERTEAFYYGGMRETRRLRLEYGYQIEGTPNHRVQLLGTDGRVRFARLDELRVGDTVVLYGGQQVFGPAGQPLPPYQDEFRTSSKTITFPERMSADLAYVLGCLTSEGAITRNGVTITNGDRRLLDALASLFERLFGLNAHLIRDPRRESVYNLQVNSRALRNWLLVNLGLEAGARNKIIPASILRASRREIAAFLRGLLLDGYVTRDGRMFGIGLASRTLLQQLQVLLLNFGVVARLHRSADHAWALTVSGAMLEHLAAFVEFDEVWKTERLTLRHEGRSHRLFNYADLMPRALTESLREMQSASTHSLRGLFGEQTPEYQRARVNLLQGHRLDRQMAHQLYQHFDDAAHPYPQEFFANDREGCLYVEVEAVESGFAEVFDLSVPGSHTFIANGLGNHNTCNFPETATEDDVAQAYFLAWELGCKGLTVYVTGSREKVVLETHATARAKEKPAEAEPTAQALAQTPLPLFHETKKPRPVRLPGSTFQVSTPLGKSFVTVNENGGGQPFEVFITTAKAGSETAAVSEAIGRLISYILRLASPVAPRERLAEVVSQLAGIGGGRSIGFGPNRVASLPDGVARALAEYAGDDADHPALPEAPTVAPGQLALKIGDLCPECGEAALVNEEGCKKCYSCGYSQC